MAYTMRSPRREPRFGVGGPKQPRKAALEKALAKKEAKAAKRVTAPVVEIEEEL